MKYTVVAFWLLLAFAPQASAQQSGAAEWHGYSYRPDQCLVVSSAGDNKFKFRDSWAYDTRKKTFKNNELTKIEQSGIHVIWLSKDATDTDVKVELAKCQQTHLDPIPAVPATDVPSSR